MYYACACIDNALNQLVCGPPIYPLNDDWKWSGWDFKEEFFLDWDLVTPH